MGGLTAPRDVCARQRSLVRNLQNSFKFSNGYGPPDSWFESGSLHHAVLLKQRFPRYARTVRPALGTTVAQYK
jgi:hypothetical protein